MGLAPSHDIFDLLLIHTKKSSSKKETNKIVRPESTRFMLYMGAISQAHKYLPNMHSSCIHKLWRTMVNTHAQVQM